MEPCRFYGAMWMFSPMKPHFFVMVQYRCMGQGRFVGRGGYEIG